MRMTVADEAGPTPKVRLVGKLDVAGADAIGVPLAMLAAKKKNIVVDMTGVTLIASLGIRHLVSAAKMLARGGGKLVLVAPPAVVREVLLTSGVADMLPIAATEDEAARLLG